MAEERTIKSGGSNFDMSFIVQSLKRGEIAFALALIAILVVLILPMPRWLLDVSLAISLMLSVLVLMTALFIERPLEFSAFPTVLLVTTMLRLALNVASTRLILGHGHEGLSAAGEVIRAFGSFVMSGNLVIGVIVFSILVLVNFVVITKGSGRIAEVSARFTLDAMPGKQMAVDADLSAGLITEAEAKKRRKELENESNFFGAMDGAAKFVRGDAIAGICITVINIVGGIIIGVAQQSMSFQDASHTYTLLTVGDGLVSQIPALIVSTAAGMLVSKTTGTGSTDKAFFSQLSAYPSALGLSSFLMASLSMLPGIPVLPFLSLACVTGYAAWKLSEGQKETGDLALAGALGALTASESATEENATASALQIDQIRLELGYGLLSLVNAAEGNKLADQIKTLRKQLAKEIGFLLPMVRIQDNLQLPSDEYVLRIKEVESGRGSLRLHRLLAMDPEGKHIDLPGEPTTEPTFGLKASWIDRHLRAEAESKGYTVVDPLTVITTHLSEVIRDNTADLLSFMDTQDLLTELGHTHQKLISELIPTQITVSGLQRVLQNLLSERISIRDLPSILEAVSEACTFTSAPAGITEHVRTRLGRQICSAFSDESGILPLVMLSPEWENTLNQALMGEGESRQLALPPSKLQELTARITEVFDGQAMQGIVPVLLVSPALRPQIRLVLERFRPSTVVLSQAEIHPKARIKTVARL